MNRDSGAGFFSGLIMGALIGVAVGFLFAPQSGTETRGLVKKKARVVKGRASKAAGRVRDIVQDRLKRKQG